ncbi:MAG TPA: Xaa-Pro peptidase family protein [Bryobacteraceae bacterium]|nr:Xaa-Pro peptidase family protein [Bryobacteraceae bacterium]
MTAPAQPAIAFDDLKVDALLVSALPNIRYLTGFNGDNALLLLTPDSTTLVTDPRFTIQASEECSCQVRVAVKGPLELVASELIRRKRLKRIGFEATRLIYSGYRRLKQALPLGASLKPLDPVIEKLRMIKSEAEIASIRQSVSTNSKAFANAVRSIRPGLTEAALAARLDFEMRRLGAEKPAFDTIVAAGPRSALPHARPTSKKILKDELLLIDMGACQDGYMSDMTRVLFLGRPSGRVRRMYDTVAKAQLAAIDAVREGATTGQVDRRARQVLESEGLGKAFVHSTGHGLGLEIHEPPRVGKHDKTRLQAGMVITIEPGAYIRGFGGIRIEDTVLVTKSGCEVLTPTSKELRLL